MTLAAPSVDRGGARRPGIRRPARSLFRRKATDRVVTALLLAGVGVSVLTTFGIVAVLIFETFEFFREVPVPDFLFGTEWTPLFDPKRFGVLPLVSGTLLVAGIAVALATNILRPLIPGTDVFNAGSAGIVVGLMVLPLVATISEDAMGAVPRSLREAAHALGATDLEVALRVVVPAALSGIAAGFILAVSRAIGETMAVAIAAGSTPVLTLDPTRSVQTMTGYIAQVSLGDTPQQSIEFRTIFAVGMTLFVMTLVLNVASQMVVRRFRNVYQ